MTFGEDKAIPVGPISLLRAKAHDFKKEDGEYFNRRERASRMPPLCAVDHFHYVAPHFDALSLQSMDSTDLRIHIPQSFRLACP
jgi:hypothetical protein